MSSTPETAKAQRANVEPSDQPKQHTPQTLAAPASLVKRSAERRRMANSTIITESETRDLLHDIQQHFDHPFSWALDERALLEEDKREGFLLAFPNGSVHLGSLLLDAAIQLALITPPQSDLDRDRADVVPEISNSLLAFASEALPADLAVRFDLALRRQLEDVNLQLFRALCRIGRDISTAKTLPDPVAMFAAAQIDALAVVASNGAAKSYEDLSGFWQPHALQLQFVEEAEAELLRLSRRVPS